MHKLIKTLLLIGIFIFLNQFQTYACAPSGMGPNTGFASPPPASRCTGKNVILNPNYTSPPTPRDDNVTVVFNWGDTTMLDTLYPPFGFAPPQGIHQYADTGIYQIIMTKLNVIDTIADTISINIIQGPLASFTFSDTCLGLATEFTNLSSNQGGSAINSWLWQFDYETSWPPNQFLDSSFVQNPPAHKFLYSGWHNVSLKVENTAGCDNTFIDSIFIRLDSNVSNIIVTTSCPCNQINFNSSGTDIVWNWDFGDGDTSILESSTHIYPLPGYYSVKLTGQSSNGCIFTDLKKIAVCPNELAEQSKSNENWVFGSGAGINFSSGKPNSFTGSQIIGAVTEGSAAISDPYTGNLLFYSDGTTVWDDMHIPLKNGTGLNGDVSIKNGTMIIPRPGFPTQYYLFTNNGFTGSAPFDLWYSIIDVSLDSVITKNVLLESNVFFEPITGTIGLAPSSCDDGYYWAVYRYAGNSYYAYKITSTGINPPVISSLGIPTPSINAATTGGGDIQFSPDGTKIATIAHNDTVQIFDFDKISGILSNVVTVPPLPGKVKSLLFSIDNSKLYVQSGTNVVEVNLTAMFMKNLGILGGGLGFNQLYIGPDNIIHNASGPYLGSISTINILGNTPRYNAKEEFLDGNNSIWSLQNIVSYKPYIEDSVKSNFTTDSLICSNEILFTNLTDTLIIDPCSFYQEDTINYAWDFGDGDSSSERNPSHIYSSPGVYNAQLVVSRPFFCLKDTFIQIITIDSTVILSFTSDTACFNDSTQFTSIVSGISHPPINYNWDNPVNSNLANPKVVIPTTNDTIIILTITDSIGCSFSDTNTVKINNIPVAIDSNYSICIGNSFTMRGGTGTGYAWFPNLFVSDSTLINPIANPDTSGIYKVIVNSLFCGTDTGLHTYTVNNLPNTQTINDTIIDLGNNITLNTSGADSYVWSPANSLDNNVIANPISNTLETITYIVLGTDSNGCSAFDTVTITVNVNEEFYIPNAFSPNGDGNNEVLLVRGLQGEKTFLLKIYDRWGNLVFKSENKNDGWDGNNLNKGVYVYWLNVTLLNDTKLEQKGNITLVK